MRTAPSSTAAAWKERSFPGADTPRLRFTVHPLFACALLLSAFTGQLLLFLCACLAAIEHECAHAFVARRYGFSLDQIVLMPYGAVISGDISGLTRRQEAAVLAAGPLSNAATALFFIALWWLYPETYPYTEAAANASLSLFFVNLLPAYPLDGGRMLRLALRPLGARRAKRLSIAVSLLFAAGIAGYFVASCFKTPAWSALFFAVFLAAGAFGGGTYARVNFSRKKSLARGVEEVRIALSAEAEVRAALRFLREDRCLVLALYEGEEFCGELYERELLAAIGRGEYGRRLHDLLPQFSKSP